MTIDYKALAERVNEVIRKQEAVAQGPEWQAWLADLRTLVTLLHMLGGQTTVPDNSQEWSRLDGIAAFLLIERHADGWADAGKMMEEWRVARSHPAPQPQRQYYSRRLECTANYPSDPDCICWHDEGTGPRSDGTAKTWREKPAPQPQPERQPVSVPTKEQITEAARALSDVAASECGIDCDDHWKVYSEHFIKEATEHFIKDATAALRAALTMRETK